MDKPLAIIPTYIRNQSDLAITLKCIDTLLSQTVDVDILVVDDGSPDSKWKTIFSNSAKSHAEIYFKPTNTGFSQTVNYGLGRAQRSDRDAILINADIIFSKEDCIENMLALQEWVVGAKLIYPTGLIQHAGVYYSLLHRDFEHIYRFSPANLENALERRTCPVTGALMLIRYEALEQVGLFDENFKMGWEDIDYCIRVFEQGGQCIYEPEAEATHVESMFRAREAGNQREWKRESWEYLHEKHRDTNFSEYIPWML